MKKPTPPKIGVSGVRGIVGESLTPQLVTSFAGAFGSYCGAGPILVGTDTRPSGEMIKQAVIAGLLGVGCIPIDTGIVPIPALMLQIRQTGAFGGIYISASHNSIEWTALKFIGSDGILLRPNQAAELTDLYHQGIYSRASSQEIGEARREDGTGKRHIEAVLRGVDSGLIRSRSFKVAVDCCNGAASVSAPALLRALGCTVEELHTSLDQPFPHHPEPSRQNIGRVCQLVVDSGAQLGFALDADADRLAIVNEKGEPLGEDCTVALAIQQRLRNSPGPVVVNISTSRMVDDIAARHGCHVYRTAVGDVHVVEKMQETGSEIGGEGNGGVIFRPINPCRDGLVGIALVLEALAAHGGSMSELRNCLPRYAMVKEKLSCAGRDLAPSMRLLQKLFAGEIVDLTDGVKVIWPDRWLHARPSGTEPIIRLIAEAPTEPEARTLLLTALECLSPTT
jgi:phosphomannomutase